MKTTENITVTDGRLNRALKKKINPIISQTVPPIVKESVDKSMLRLGRVSKYYPYLDKAEVKLLNSQKEVLCKLPHRFMGNLLDLFTPQGSKSYCKKRKEPCIIPHAELPCAVMKIHEGDSDEWFLLDYYTPDDLLFISVPQNGHARLTCMTATNETYLDFGLNGLNVLSSKPIKTSYGEFEKDITEVDYANADNVYTKEEVYTKKEVDDLIAKKIEEALKNNEINEDADNDTTN